MALVREARREGRAIEVVALDRDPVIAGLAVRACAAYPEIRVVEGDALDPPFADRSFDLVVANLFLHHFDLDAAVDVVSRLRRLATQAVLINDLRRHRLPHALFSAAGWILVRHPRAFDDGKLSVLRGFTPRSSTGSPSAPESAGPGRGPCSRSASCSRSGGMRTTTDLVVLGAGPAGSVLAWLAARAGLTVVVLERDRFPRDKVCGEFMSSEGAATLARVGALDPCSTRRRVDRSVPPERPTRTPA